LTQLLSLGFWFPVVADEEPRRHGGTPGDQPFDHPDRRIARRRHAEDQLEVRIGEFERRAQRLFEEIVEPAYRTHDADGRQFPRLLRQRPRPATPSRNRDAEDVEEERDAAE
jgi:hypothetical protein